MSTQAYVYSYYIPHSEAEGRVVSKLTPMVGDCTVGLDLQLSRRVQLWPVYDARGELVEPAGQGWDLYRSIDPGMSYWDFPVEQIETFLSETTDPLEASVLASAWRDWLQDLILSLQDLARRNKSELDAVLNRTLNAWANEQSCYLP